MTAVVLVHHDDYADWVFDSHHPTQGRRFMKSRELLLGNAVPAGVEVIEFASDYLPHREILEAVHEPEYVDEVITHGRSGEWTGERPDLGGIARRMVGGTMLAATALLGAGLSRRCTSPERNIMRCAITPVAFASSPTSRSRLSTCSTNLALGSTGSQSSTSMPITEMARRRSCWMSRAR